MLQKIKDFLSKVSESKALLVLAVAVIVIAVFLIFPEKATVILEWIKELMPVAEEAAG